MQEIHDTPVFQKVYDLYKHSHEAIKKYPKGDRHSLGEKTQRKILGLLESVTKAGHAKKEWKVPHIEQALVDMELIKIFLRLGYDTRCLDQRKYLALQERLQEIGRMLGGWKKSI